MTRLVGVFALVTAVIVHPALADAAEYVAGSMDCFGQLGSILAAGGYTGGLDCKAIHVDIRRVGEISLSSTIYTVYDLRYRTIPKSPEMVAHGGQKLIIILDNKTYIGQYFPGLSETSKFLKVSVIGQSIFVDVPKEWGNEIKFGPNGPPSNVYLDADNIELFK